MLQAFGALLIAVLGGAFLLFFGAWFIAIIGVFLLIFVIAWACGVPIKITKNGEVTGHLVRNKFIPLRK